ncbi:MAG: aspartate--tRNA ligase [Holosporales bacterium]|jgi:aspartyl-tRNA synthetase|nr:aspartate--tRNA ligase [Holosporales bacterium]
MTNKNATIFRTHTCNDLGVGDVGSKVSLCGFVHRIRDHGGLLFIDLRDHYGTTQCVLQQDSAVFSVAEKLKDETVIRITGAVVKRDSSTINAAMGTGEIELQVDRIEVLSEPSCVLPVQVNVENEFPEETRLTYRYLDLRKRQMHENVVLRSRIISYIREEMTNQGFLEIQTPILTASSPEGARDYLVPSRISRGKFYALPQAPQQFKQLLMVAGFDKYFQIAPCFRDEDARADRSPGEFYQLDMEMSFVSQEDVFAVLEQVLHRTFVKFAPANHSVSPYPFPRITFDDAMLHYGSDKPDLRNPLLIQDVTGIFRDSSFTAFSDAIKTGAAIVRSINVPRASSEPRSFFEKLDDWAKKAGLPGLGYVSMVSPSEAKGPIAKFLSQEELQRIADINKAQPGDVVFFICHKDAAKIASLVRSKVAEQLGLIDENSYKFCWVVDFPMFEYDEEQKQIVFSHNPFSMPQGGLEALQNQDPLSIKAYQYDIVCNGVELSSGAIRNHSPEVMYKAFEIAGHSREFVDKKFSGMIRAFKCGAPPHGGCAPGIDRIVMLLAKTENIREVIAFPFNQQAQDLMMGAPAEVTEQQLKELHIAILPETKKR